MESGQKVLVFTQFKEMGTILEQIIFEAMGKRPLFLHGGCSVKERKTMVERFQTNKGDQIFLLSLKAAGTGLNLTAASHVIHFDLWWNPAVESQATDRPCLSYRTASECVGLSLYCQKYFRRTHQRNDSAKERTCRYDYSHRRKLDWRLK